MDPNDAADGGESTKMKERHRRTKFTTRDAEIAAVSQDLSQEDRRKEERRIRNCWSSKESHRKKRAAAKKAKKEAEEAAKAREAEARPADGVIHGLTTEAEDMVKESDDDQAIDDSRFEAQDTDDESDADEATEDVEKVCRRSH